MKNKLLWRLWAIIGLGTVVLFLAIDWLTNHTETSMSFIADTHQQTLLNYGKQAEHIYLTQGEDALAEYIKHIQLQEQTWAGVVTSKITPFADSELVPLFTDYFQLGRGVEWKIHLYFAQNPIMEVPFVDDATHLLIQLPQRMRPGAFLMMFRLLLQIALPLILLCLLTYVVYQHVMRPLKRLEKATQEFSDGKLDARVTPLLPKRHDELTDIAATFDKMADRTSSLIQNQRQLLADLSHELRTPLARIDMAVDFVEQNLNQAQALERLRYEASTMRSLVEDTLTFSWLSTELPSLNTETFDLVELINVICDDAKFEYPHNMLHCDLPEQAMIDNSSQVALGQAIENVIRNALRYTPPEKAVSVHLKKLHNTYTLTISDNGPGVPDALCDDIFKPFFRVEKSRTATKMRGEGEAAAHSQKNHGHGMGLALAQRQVHAVGGEISAHNRIDDTAGLTIAIALPINATSTTQASV